MSNSRKKNKMLAILLSIAMIFINFAVPSAGFAATSPSVYKVLFDVKDGDGHPVDSPSIHVWTEYWDGDTEDILPDENGRYEMDKYTDYNYTVSKEGYVAVSETLYTPEGPDAEMTLEITLQKDSPDQKKAEAVKKQFDKEIGALRPDFAKDKNICEMVLAKVKGYGGLDTEGVTVSLASSTDDSLIAKDGKINYIKKDELTGATNSKNVRCSFNFECGKAKATSSERTVTVGWDRDFFNSKIKDESKLLTADKIKGENKSLSEVTKDLTLPRCMGKSLQKVWSTVKWESSDPNVISFVKPEIDSDIYPLTGKVHPSDKDKTVTLTATFNANDTVLNSYLEKPVDFEQAIVKFDVTVKGNGAEKPTEAELKALLDKYYKADMLKDSITGDVIDTQNVTGDINLPRYTKIKGDDGKLVFKNKEIKVTSGNEKLVKINGYRANVDIFAKENPNVDLIVEFTRDGVTVEKKIPLKVGVVTDEELDAEIAKMELAKKHYFDGINDGSFENPESVTGDLHPFKEMRTDKDGKLVWIYNAKDYVGDGIVPDDFFEDSWEMEGAGYNKFKSSDNSVVRHDNLIVTKPENTTKVEISSLLSSAKYGKYAKAHPENEKLQKLYKQEVKVTVTVKGTKPDPQPEKPDVVKTVKLNVFGALAMDKAPAIYTGDVSSDEAKKAGFEKSEKYKNEVTVIDALVVLHRDMFGEDFDKNPENYLKMSKQGWISKIFGVETFNSGYLVNGKVPEYPDKPGTGSVANDTVLGANDTVSAFIYSDTTGYSDIYLEFTEKQITAKTGEKFTITLQGMKPMSFGAPDKMSPKAGFTVRLTSADNKDVYLEAVTNKDGNVEFKIPEPGVYTASVVAGAEYYIQPYAKVTVEKSESYDIDKKAAADVDAKIDAIGEVTLDKKADIEAARKAYDDLTEAQKKLVTKLEALEKAEAEYKALEDQLAADKKPGTDDKKPVTPDKKPGAQAPDSSKAPQTGDDTQTAGLVVLLISAICTAYMARKKEN